jgi:hypothetical protein
MRKLGLVGPICRKHLWHSIPNVSHGEHFRIHGLLIDNNEDAAPPLRFEEWGSIKLYSLPES